MPLSLLAFNWFHKFRPAELRCLFQTSTAPALHDEADHRRVKQRNHNACREQVPCAVKPVLCRLNMDAQDAQDNQDTTLLHKRPTPAMIACGFADV